MAHTVTRRGFLKTTSAGLLAAGMGASASRSPNDRVVLGIMGVNGRGKDLSAGFSSLANVEITTICDVDERAIPKAIEIVMKKQARQPQGIRDFRRILDDKNVDALAIAAPDHWHAPATILACQAGKHVYCEKPASHNPWEGEMMVAAARKHERVVQLGTQRRSMPGVIEAIAKVRSGAIGRVLFSRGWYNNTRGSIGHGKPAPVPAWLDYALWQGPAPDREYRDNIIHYNWHWFWHWGTGELGNNGIHALDVCRWGLGVDAPLRVTSNGGRYYFDDDWQTPDTNVVTFDFGDKAITWEGRSCQPRGFEGIDFGAAFYGDQGTLVVDGGGYRVYDPKGKEIEKVTNSASELPHLQNFIDSIRAGKRPNADIEEGVKSTLLCHLGNIAYRTGRTLHLDPKTHKIVNDPQAAALWKRDYRPGWEPKV